MTAYEEVQSMVQGPWTVPGDDGDEESMLSISRKEAARLLDLASELDTARKNLGNNQTQRLFSKS